MSTPWDKVTWSLIFLLLIIQIGSCAYYFNTHLHLKFVILFCVLAFISQLVLIYGSYIEPHWLEFKTEEIIINNNSDSQNLRIVLVADYHLGPYKDAEFVKKTVAKINASQPDLVVIAGDFIYSFANQADQLYPLQDIQSVYGVYAVLGNHDYGLTRSNKEEREAPGAIHKSDYVAQKLGEFKVQVLRNENRSITLASGTEIKIVGLEDMWGNLHDFSLALKDVVPEDTVILLEHNPDIILDSRSQVADLILSGHTHGGQVRLPFIGSFYPIPTKLGRQYDYGLFELDSGNKLYITKGLGEIGPRARLFCRPEIVLLNVKI